MAFVMEARPYLNAILVVEGGLLEHYASNGRSGDRRGEALSCRNSTSGHG